MKTRVAPLVIALAATAAACDQTAGTPEPSAPSATAEPLTLPPQETAPEAGPPADETTPPPSEAAPPPGEANPDMLGRG